MEKVGSLISVGQPWSAEPFHELWPVDSPHPLRITAIHDPPYFMFDRQANGSLHFSGYLFELWEIIARELKLPYRIIEPPPGTGYGSLDENGTWTGLVGELAYGCADLALSGIILRPDRASVVDFLDAVAVSQDQPTFYIRRGSGEVPALTPAVFDSLLRPLDASIWWLVLASLLVTSLVLHATIRLNHAGAESPRTVREMSWGMCLFSSFMTLVNQGWSLTPDSLSARTATLASWVLGILVYYTYTANLISHLTVNTVDRPISSLQEFSQQPGWTFAMEPGYGILNTWKKSSDAYERELYTRTVTGEGFLLLDIAGESKTRTTDPKVMTYIDIDRLLKSIGTKGCQLVPLLTSLPPKGRNYMPIAKGHEKLRQAINHLMRQLNQAGIISKLLNSWMPSEQSKCDYPQTAKALGMSDLVAILIIIPIALTFVAVIFTIECFLPRTTFRRPLLLPKGKVPAYRTGQKTRHRKLQKRKVHFMKRRLGNFSLKSISHY